MIAGCLPEDLPFILCTPDRRQLALLLAEPEIQLPRARQFRKLAKYQIDGRAHTFIGILLDAITGREYVADRHADKQLSAARLLRKGRLRAFAKAGDLHLADRTLHPQ